MPERREKRIGRATIRLQTPPVIAGAASVVGPLEGRGPLGSYFDVVKPDVLLGEKSWERAESKLLSEAVELAARNAGWRSTDADLLLAGDLLNQIVSSSFAARDLAVPYIGLYGACSTMTLSLGLGALCLDGGFARKVLVGTVSHHDAAERQYRYPSELGVQRLPTSQWTLTGAGAVALAAEGRGPRVTHVTFGKVLDLGQKDPNDMGSAMAPAATDTILRHLEDTGRGPADYDLIVTGDLARVGHPLAAELLSRAGVDVSAVFKDCGIMVYAREQDVHAGGSGCGCSAVVFTGYLLKEMAAARLRRVLLVSTGALHSPTTYQQGETIPGVAHAVAVEA